MRPRLSLAALAAAILVLCAAASGDRVLYQRTDGQTVELKPADDRYPIDNQPVDSAVINRPDGRQGLWVNPSTQPVVEPTTPVETPPGTYVAKGGDWAKAFKAAKPGTVVYLERGGTYNGGLTDPSLRLTSVTLSAYGTGEKPVVRVASGTALSLYKAQSVRIDNIEFRSDTPSAPGLRFWGCKDFSVTACKVSGFTFGITAEAFNGRGKSFKLADSLITGNYHPQGQDASGVFVSAQDGINVTGCTFDTNGWFPGKNGGSLRNHNFYGAGDNTGFVFTSNVSARASSHGLQARCGGDIRNNTFIDNPIHLSYGLVNGGGPIVEGGVTGTVDSNTFVGTRLLAGQPRGYAMEVSNVKDASITNNTFANAGMVDTRLTGAVAAIKLDACKLDANHPQKSKVKKIGKLVLSGNKCTWQGGLLQKNVACDDLQMQTSVASVNVASVRAAVGQ